MRFGEVGFSLAPPVPALELNLILKFKRVPKLQYSSQNVDIGIILIEIDFRRELHDQNFEYRYCLPVKIVCKLSKGVQSESEELGKKYNYHYDFHEKLNKSP